MFICIAKIPAGIQKPLLLHTAKGNRTHRDAYKYTATKNRTWGLIGKESHSGHVLRGLMIKPEKYLQCESVPWTRWRGHATWFPHLAVVWIGFSKSARNWLIQWVDIHDSMGKKSPSTILLENNTSHMIWNCCMLTYTNIYQNDLGPNSKIRSQATSVTYRCCDRVCSDVVWTATGKKICPIVEDALLLRFPPTAKHVTWESLESKYLEFGSVLCKMILKQPIQLVIFT